MVRISESPPEREGTLNDDAHRGCLPDAAVPGVVESMRGGELVAAVVVGGRELVRVLARVGLELDRASHAARPGIRAVLPGETDRKTHVVDDAGLGRPAGRMDESEGDALRHQVDEVRRM